MVWLVYFFLMYMFVTGIWVLSFWNKKANQWVSGRKNWADQLKRLPVKKHKRIWFHVSSLGEFEQARPVIEKLKSREKDLDIVLTFFSPSGYRIRSNYPLAYVFYLPADLPGNAAKWLEMVKPDLAVFVKYDLWPGFLHRLKRKNIPAILISAHWTRSQTFTSWNMPPTRSLLVGFRQIFLQQGDDLDYFQAKGFYNLSVSGDTRIDRCLDLPSEAGSKIPEVLKALQPFDLVAGSTWPPDEKLLQEVTQKLNLKLLIAPHDVSETNIIRLIKLFPIPVARLSTFIHGDVVPRVMVVDNIGLLAYLYSLGKIAYIGGGFGAGIHNTLEPMAHGKPLLFGPAFKKFPEAVTMINENAAIAITGMEDLVKAIHFFKVPQNAAIAGSVASNYMLNHKGASDKVVNYILESIPFGHKV